MHDFGNGLDACGKNHCAMNADHWILAVTGLVWLLWGFWLYRRSRRVKAWLRLWGSIAFLVGCFCAQIVNPGIAHYPLVAGWCAMALLSASWDK